MTKAETKKQVGDQALHLAISILAVWVLAEIMPAWPAGYVALVAWGFWEARQKNSARLWDPYLDWFFQSVGVGLGIWTCLP